MKKIYLLFAVIIFSLFSFNTVFCAGKLADQDAYDTYIGKTVSDVTGTISGIYKLEDGWNLADLVSGEDGKRKALLFHADETDTIDKTAFVCERSISEFSTISVFDGLRAAIYLGTEYLGFGGAGAMMELMTNPQTDENSYSISFEFTDITCEAEPGLMTDLIPAFDGSPMDPHEVYNVICYPNNAGDKPAADKTWEYEILADNTARIIGYTGNEADIIVPDSLDGYPVSSISREYGYSWPVSLKSVVLPEGLTTVGGSAFMSCGSLETVILPAGLQQIGDLAFYGCDALSRIDLPEGLVSVGNSAFSSCSALETISLPSTLTEIGGDIFSYCSNLKFIMVSSKNPLLSVKNNSLYKQDELLIYPSGTPYSAYEIEDGTSVIGSYAFYGNKALTSVSLPESIITIRDGAFQGCENLISFTVPNGVVSIGKNVFTDCSSLKSLVLPGSLAEIDENLFGYGGAPDDLVITAESGSYAQQWAEERGFAVNLIPAAEPEVITEPAAPAEPPAPQEPTKVPEPTEAPKPAEAPEPTVMEEPEEEDQYPLKVGDTFTFGLYEQDEEPGTEPIEWQVLAVKNGRALLISRYGLEAKKYNDDIADVTWETCTLRAWLNGDFYNSAFTDEERSGIVEVTNTNPDNAEWDTDGGNDTLDRIFLLSLEEAETYFADDTARACEQTYRAEQKGSLGFWWLRSAGYAPSAAAMVFSDGYIFGYGDIVDSETNAARPAFWLDLSGADGQSEKVPPSEPEEPERPTGMPEPGGSGEPVKPEKPSRPTEMPEPAGTAEPVQPEGPQPAEEEPESADGSAVVVKADLLRDAPDITGTVIRSVLGGVEVEKLEERTVNGTAWVRIRTPQGQTGWVHSWAFE